MPKPHDPYTDLVPPQGIKLTPAHYAYLKISEGCNHRCTFCIIPSMRGDLVSRPIGEVMLEAENLVKGGVKELLVISQDTSAYGVDIKYRTGFVAGRPTKTRMLDLCRALGELGVWVRLHYVYPYPHVDEVIPLMAEGRILPYLDVPFQHASPRILRLMRGGGPMIVAASGAAVFAETLTGGQWLGVLLVCGSIVAFASGAHDRRATLFALANAAVIGAYTLIDAQGVRASAAPVSYTLWFFAANALVIIAIGTLKRGSAVPRYLGRHWRRALVGGACSVGAYAIALWAMTRAPVALVAVLRETSVIFAAVLAALVLKEKLTRRRLFATGAVLAGLILLRL